MTAFGPNSTPRNEFDIAVVHLTFEGFQLFGGGVCAVTRGHMAALGRLREEFAAHGVRITPYAAEIAYNAGHPRWVPGGLERGRQQLRDMGGELFLLPNYSDGSEPRGPWGVPELGGMENWKALSGAASGLLFSLAQRHETVLAYCHDVPYALTSVYAGAQRRAAGLDISTLFVSHASALTHEMPIPNPERLMVECAAVQWAKVDPGARLGVISDFMRAQIVEDYGAAEHTLVRTGNGIDPTDPWYRRRDRLELEDRLAAEDIPLDRPLVVSFGRAAGFKRHDLVLRAAAELGGDAHLVLMTDLHRDDLHALRRDLDIDATLITSFDKELVAALVQWPGTSATVLYSENEPCGIMPMEVRLLARDTDTVLVLSDSGGFAEQSEHGVDTIVGRSGDHLAAAAALRQALGMSYDERAEMARRSAQRVLRDSTWTGQALRTLVEMYPDLADRAAQVADTLDRANLAAVASTSAVAPTSAVTAASDPGSRVLSGS
jgi:glycosyltransferase involved in cell wall biosynthesis